MMYKIMSRKKRQRTIYAEQSATANTERVKRVTLDANPILSAKDEQSDVIRELRDVPPLHYLFKIKNFSQLSNATADNFESAEFEVGGYKWKLSLYPKGNKRVNEKDHVSLYLVLCKSKGFTFQREVNVCLKLFVYNQTLDKYLAIQEHVDHLERYLPEEDKTNAKGRVSRFRGMKREWGFDKLVPFSVFNDASNGYLINDCCIFGAEVFVLEGSSKGECASIVKELDINSYSWKIEDFAELEAGAYFSDDFDMCGYKWKLEFHPTGFSEKNKSLSAYLGLEDTLKPGHGLYVEYVLRVRDQINGNHHERSDRQRFSASTSENWGFGDFMPLSKLNDPSQGYITDGAMILEVQLSLITKVKEFS